ncbi:MAG TPA: dihydropteroate synthase [Acidimicrobiia bacterium]
MSRGWRLRTRTLPLDRPLLMGIVNVTPDSFSDGGAFLDPQAAIAHGKALAEAGADLIDVGGESTRPGAAEVSADDELARVIGVVEALAGEGLAVSIDTAKSRVAEPALEAGAEVVNDVTALSDPAMPGLVSGAGAGLVLMHMQGSPRTMQVDPIYADVVAEVRDYLVARAARAEEAGIERDRIAIDPGIGFGKTLEHNLLLLAGLGELVGTGYPVLVGTSRKTFLGRLTGIDDPARRDLATAVSVALAAERGAAIFRVHDVAASREALAIATAMVERSETRA